MMYMRRGLFNLLQYWTHLECLFDGSQDGRDGLKQVIIDGQLHKRLLAVFVLLIEKVVFNFFESLRLLLRQHFEIF